MSAKHRARIIAVGDELLLGRTQDTNSAWLARWCIDHGFQVTQTAILGDVEDELVDALKRAAKYSDLVVLTGGLGPTEDDRTRHALATAMGVPLKESEQAWKQIVAYWKIIRRGVKKPPASNRRQALMPKGARILKNDRGTAPGMLGKVGDAWVACLPGVPHEMKAMAERLGDILAQKVDNLVVPAVDEVHFAGLGESSAQDLLGDLLVGERPRVGITAHELGHITVRPVGSATAVKKRCAAVRKILKPYLLPAAGLAPSLVHELSRKKMTITMAESCTCGHIVARLGAVPGASAVLREGLVAYHNDVKELRLGVDQAVLDEHGAVSERVVRQMAEGIRSRAKADLALATSGIAGPDGGTPDKPVGTVWIAAATKDKTVASVQALRGDRARIQQRAASQALLIGWQLLNGKI